MKRVVVFFVLIFLVVVAVGLTLSNLISTNRRSVSTIIKDQEGVGTVRLIDEESAVIDVIANVSSSVVTISVVRDRPVYDINPFGSYGFFDAPSGNETQEADIGSGFIISEDGLVVTNKHVVDSPDYQYLVITSDNESHKIQNIYRDPMYDLAILKMNPSEGSKQALNPVTLGDSDNLKVGQTVIALGTPLGEFRGTATKGIVSGLSRGITAGSAFQRVYEELDDVIQTDAAINPGNSGGPLLNTAGQVIGVNTAVASGAENIGFALPINLVKEALANFEETGSFDRAFLGVSYRIVNRELSVMNDIPEGAYVVEVVSDSAAEQAGIKKGDIIISFDGTRIKDSESESLADMIAKKRKGDTASVVIWRDSEEINLTVSLGEFDGL